MHPGAWSLAVPGALASAALVEMFPAPVEDNLTSPLVSGLVLNLLMFYSLMPF